jgi:hypothetical protein
MNELERIGTFVNILEKVSTECTLSDIPGNILNIDSSGMQFNNKPGSVITDSGSTNVRVLTTGEKTENFTVVVCCNVADTFGTFLPLF